MAVRQRSRKVSRRTRNGAVDFALHLDHAELGADDIGDVLLEALDGFLELADIRVLEGDVGGEEFVEGLVLFE